MKRIPIANIFLVFLFCFSVTHILGAATYYVDFQNGSNMNNGLSPSTPFKNAPGDDNATGNASLVDLNVNQPNTVIFKGGVQYNGRIDLDWSGSSNANRITYQGNTDVQDWGSGKAIIDGQDTRYRGFYSGSARDYITIKNFEIRNMAHAVATTAGIGIGSESADSTGIEIRDCYVHDIGRWDDPTYSGNQLAGGIFLLRPNSSIVDNNELTKTCTKAIALGGARNSTVSNNYVHDYFAWGVDLYWHGQYHDGNTIVGNTFVNGFYYDAGYHDSAHADIIYIRQGSPMTEAGAGRNVVVERNLIFNNETFDEHGGTASITVARCKNVTVRNNIIINPHSYPSVAIGWADWVTGVEIYNNTIYAPRSGCYGIEVGDGSAIIINNIVVSDRYGIYRVAADVTLTSDHNLFFAAQDNLAYHDAGTSRTFSSWQGQGYDANSSDQAAIADIKFIDISGYPTANENMNLKLSFNSPAINTGIDLTGTVDNDFEGMVRPQGALWDIGAYEYLESGGGGPLAPKSLRISD